MFGDQGLHHLWAYSPRFTLTFLLAGALVLGWATPAVGATAAMSSTTGATATMVGAASVDDADGAEEVRVVDEVIATSTDSVGLIRSAGRNGSGWIAGEDTVVTNLHVAVAGTGDIYVDYSDGERIECYTAVGSRDMDLAVLRCDTGDRDPLPLRTSVPPGDTPVAVIGYPGSTGPLTTHGVLTGVRTVVRGTPTVGFTAEVAPGSSGSPVVDPAGQVVAVATFSGGMGVPTAELLPLLDAANRFPPNKAGAEWQLRLRRASLVAVPVLAVGFVRARRRGRDHPVRVALGWMIGGVLVALALTQVQFMINGPAHLI